MHGKRGVLGLALVALLVVLLAPAALAGAYSIGVSGGLGAPLSDFKDAFNSGWNGAGMADYELAPMWGIGADLGYHTWKASDAVIKAALLAAPPGTTLDDKLSAFQYGLHGTATPPMLGPIHPFAQVGAAMYSLKDKSESNYAPLATETSKSLFGWNAGAGVNFTMMPTLSLGLDGIYHNINSKKDFGSNATWFSVNGKLTFHIPMVK